MRQGTHVAAKYLQHWSPQFWGQHFLLADRRSGLDRVSSESVKTNRMWVKVVKKFISTFPFSWLSAGPEQNLNSQDISILRSTQTKALYVFFVASMESSKPWQLSSSKSNTWNQPSLKWGKKLKGQRISASSSWESQYWLAWGHRLAKLAERRLKYDTTGCKTEQNCCMEIPHLVEAPLIVAAQVFNAHWRLIGTRICQTCKTTLAV